MTDAALIATILGARTRADVDRAEAELVRRFGARRTRYLGDNEANWSSVSGAVDPQAVVFERVTNIWDAIIEAEAQRQRDFTCKTPQEAATRFLGVPAAGIAEMSDGEQRHLAKLAAVQLLDSDDSVRRPTIAFRDLGIGLTFEEMPDSILSLERSNKLRKPYLHGVFGKGGSVVCMFSEATIVITRRQPDLLAEGEEDRVAVAIVREDDAEDMGLPFFRYLVSPETNLPYSVSASEVDFEPGTMVMHVGYRAEKMGRETWQLENSIYAFAETLLFRPTLPYQLQDARSGEANKRKTRPAPSVLTGLGQRLDGLADGTAGLVEHSRPATLDVPGVGPVDVRWWLFEDENNVRRRAARGHRVLFHAAGHAHHVWSKQRLKTLVPELRRVGERLVIEVDTSGVPQKTLRRIFSSFREATLKSAEAAALEKAVSDWISEQPDLAEAEDKLTREAFQRAGGGVSQAFRRRLNQAFRGRLHGLGGGTTRRGRSKRRRRRSPEELYSEPTVWTGPSRILAVPGQRAALVMECNAVDGFVPDRGEVTIEGDGTFTTSIGDLRHGRLQVAVEFPADEVLGLKRLQAKLSYLKDAGGYAELGWPVEVELVEKLPERKGNGKGTRGRREKGEIAFLWQSANSEDDWTGNIPGDLQFLAGDHLADADPGTYGDLRGETGRIPTVCLNRDFQDLAAYLRGALSRGASDDAIEGRKERYALAVGSAVANLYQGEQELESKYREWEDEQRTGQSGEDEPPRPMTEEQRQRALEQAARGVVALLPDFDALLGEAVEEDERDAVAAG
jgi:hypothetical protein